MTDSSGGLIGGGCTGGLFFLCFALCMLYRLFRSDPRTHPAEVVVRHEIGASSQQNGAGADALPLPCSPFYEPCSIEPLCFTAGKN